MPWLTAKVLSTTAVQLPNPASIIPYGVRFPILFTRTRLSPFSGKAQNSVR